MQGTIQFLFLLKKKAFYRILTFFFFPFLKIDNGSLPFNQVGIIDTNGEKLEACTIYPDLRRNNPHDGAAKQLKDLLMEHKYV